MNGNRKVTGTASSMAGGLAVGSMASLVVTIAGAFLAGSLIEKEMINQQSVGYCAMVILVFASAVGSVIAVKRIKHRRLFVCGMIGVIYYGILLATTALFFGGQYQAMGVTALLVWGGCGAVALAGARGEQGRRSRKRRKVFR